MELFKKEIVNDKEELVKVEAYTKDELATEVEKLKDE
jgi:hypothetical protein